MAAKREGAIGWDDYFMSIAFVSGRRSKDPVTQVGACIVDKNNKIVGVGYNGMPIGCHDNIMPWNKKKDSEDTSWLESKTPYVCHAEMNAILNRFTADLTDSKMYASLHPCNECAKMIVQSGIKEVIYASDKYHDRKEWAASRRIMEMVGMKMRNSKMPHKRHNYLEWEEYFMSIAFLSAQRSKDPVTQVGACIVNPQNKIVGIGYNGMPIGCKDDEMPWNRQGKDETSTSSWLSSKSPYVCHAELNAVLNKNLADVSDCKIYVALFPCNTCAQIIVQSGIKEIIFYSDKYHDKPPFMASKQLLDMAGIKYRQFRPSQKKVVIDFEAIERTPFLDGSVVSKGSRESGTGLSSKDGDCLNDAGGETVNNNNKGVQKSCSFANRVGAMDATHNLQAAQIISRSTSLFGFDNWASGTVISVMFVFVAVLFTWFGSLLHTLVVN